MPLVSPYAGFSSPGGLRVTPAILFFLIFVIYTTGLRIGNEFYRSPEATALRVEDLRRRSDGMMAGAPPGVRERMLRNEVSRISGKGSVLTDAAATVIPGALFLLYVLEAGALAGLCAQFLGGEERGEGPHRGGKLLSAYAFLPLSFRRLASGALVWLQDPSGIRNAPGLEEYRKATGISFSLLSYAGLDSLPRMLRTILFLATDPFYIWSMLVLAFGFAAVYGVRPGKGAVAAAVVTTALAGTETVLETIGITGVAGSVL